jgi:pyruvate formate lyase activating enzyme
MCNTGFISEIQRFSLGDGDGIRTTVFMQGCNLHCPWCHNPETINKNGSLLFYKNLCVSCGKCADGCLNGVKKFSAQHMAVYEVYNIILQDIEFYAKSNGGLTISGGEPLLQIDFCVELAEKCFENNISVIIDTAGDVPFDTFEKIIPFVDCFYFDLKSDIEGYNKIGADGKHVYDNLSRLAAISKTVARIPVIPGFNNSRDNMENFAEFLCDINIYETHLLPFHRLGSGKYKALGLKYDFEDCPPESTDNLKIFAEIFTSKNIKVLLEE